MTKLIDANRNPTVDTIFGYNLDDRLIKKTYADGKYLTYAYDKAGLLTTATNARSIATTFTYDQNHNLLKTDYADSTPDVTNTYDDYNRLSSRTDGTGMTTYGYDNNGRLTSHDGPQSNDAITYQYDELGRVKSLLPQTGQALSYVYDALGRLKDIQAGTNTFTYAYFSTSHLIQTLTRPNGTYTEYQYNDPLKKQTSLINKKSTGEVINQFDYTYNDRDLIATETVTNGQIIDNFIAGTTTETPNILNQIMSRTAQGQTKTYVYDLDGNMTTGFTPEGYAITMTYDAQNRMITAQYQDGNSVVHKNEYNYAGNSLLAELKKYNAGALTATTKYLRSGFLPMQERDSANTVLREYTWGLNPGGGIGGLLTLKQGGADYSYLYDGKGNVAALIDSTQNLVASYAYDPFGQLMSKSGTLDQPYTFSTKEYDSRTGLNYYGYRFYDSCSGKWTTRDPLKEEGGINLYQAMGNNAVNFVDSLGLQMRITPSGKVLQSPSAKSTCDKPVNKPIDWCGSGWTEPLVPDFPVGVNIQQACINHDRCYGEDGAKANSNRSDCDFNLGYDIRDICLKQHPENPATCTALGGSYYVGIRILGRPAFKKARRDSVYKIRG